MVSFPLGNVFSIRCHRQVDELRSSNRIKRQTSRQKPEMAEEGRGPWMRRVLFHYEYAIKWNFRLMEGQLKTGEPLRRRQRMERISRAMMRALLVLIYKGYALVISTWWNDIDREKGDRRNSGWNSVLSESQLLRRSRLLFVSNSCFYPAATGYDRSSSTTCLGNVDKNPMMDRLWTRLFAGGRLVCSRSSSGWAKMPRLMLLYSLLKCYDLKRTKKRSLPLHEEGQTKGKTCQWTLVHTHTRREKRRT